MGTGFEINKHELRNGKGTMKTSKRLFYALAAVVCLVANQSRADVVFDSLGGGVADQVFINQIFAQSFVMPNSGDLLSVVLNMAARDGSGGAFSVSLYGNAVGDIPGTSFASLTGNTDPSAAGLYTYVPSGTVSLAQGSTYWVVGTSTADGFSGWYNWMHGNGNPSVGTEIGWAYNDSNGWLNMGTGSPMEMQVNAVPEAAVMLTNGAVLLAVGLGWWYYRRRALTVA
jgi:hypothetical protein